MSWWPLRRDWPMPWMADLSQPSRRAGGVLARYRHIGGGAVQPWHLRSVPVCSSTEPLLGAWLRDKPSLDGPRAVIATRQRRGTGQWGRRWLSPPGGVWLSAALPWNGRGGGRAGLLGLALAVSMAERLEYHGVSVQIKWPNDLLVEGRKLAGLLPAVVQRGCDIRLLRIGLGLNVSNRVPVGAVALRQCSGISMVHPDHWVAEVLLALDRCQQAGGDGTWCLEGLKKRLWADHLRHPRDGQIWQIAGVDADGALQLCLGDRIERWHRWP